MSMIMSIEYFDELYLHGRQKLADKWASDVYTAWINRILMCQCILQSEGGGAKKMLHRNLLLPVSTIRDEREELPPKQRPKPKPRKRKESDILVVTSKPVVPVPHKIPTGSN
jgi:hypothetical protein